MSILCGIMLMIMKHLELPVCTEEAALPAHITAIGTEGIPGFATYDIHPNVVLEACIEKGFAFHQLQQAVGVQKSHNPGNAPFKQFPSSVPKAMNAQFGTHVDQECNGLAVHHNKSGDGVVRMRLATPDVLELIDKSNSSVSLLNGFHLRKLLTLPGWYTAPLLSNTVTVFSEGFTRPDGTLVEKTVHDYVSKGLMGTRAWQALQGRPNGPVPN